MNHVMRLKKLDQYNPSFLPFEKLKAYGIGAVRGPRRMPHSLICEPVSYTHLTLPTIA